jgi:hypothetical protein
VIFAKNNIEVGAANWSAPYLLQSPGLKLDVMVNVEDDNEQVRSPVYFQTTESEQQSFSGADAVDTKMLLRHGFHSRPFDVPFTAIRFMSYGPSPALIDFVVYGF